MSPGTAKESARRLEHGRRHFERGDFAAAAECFEAAARAVGSRSPAARDRARHLAGEAHACRGVALHHDGRDAEAERALGRAIEHAPRHAGALQLRARLYYRSGRWREAIEDARSALPLRPGSVDLHLLLASCEDQRGQAERALRGITTAVGLFEHARCAPPGARESVVHAAPAEARGARGRPPGSKCDGPLIASARRAVRERPSYADLRHRLACLLIGAGRIGEAEVELERALRINPGYIEARILSARLRLDRGRPTQAARILARAVETHADYPDLHFWLGVACLRGSEPERGMRSLETAVALNREFARAQRLLALARFRVGHAGALRALRRGFTRDRELPDALATAASAIEMTPDERVLRPALAVQPDYPDLHLALARAERARGRLERAAEGCRAALELRPSYSAASLELARIELELGRPDRAEERLTPLALRHPAWPDAQALLGYARRLRGDGTGAQEPLRNALMLNPGYTGARDELASAVVGERAARSDSRSSGWRAWWARPAAGRVAEEAPRPMP